MWFRRFTISVIIMALFCFCSDESQAPAENEEEFMIYSLGVAFGPYNPDLGMAGDFMFCEELEQVFVPFGIESNGKYQTLCFEYFVSRHAVIRSITHSRVTDIHHQLPTKDYKIKTSAAEGFTVIYNHITNHSLQEGDTLFPDDFVGNPGPWAHYCYHTKIQIMLLAPENYMAACPFLYLVPEKKVFYKNKINQLMTDWEQFKSDTTIFSQDSLLYPGCYRNFAAAEP